MNESIPKNSQTIKQEHIKQETPTNVRQNSKMSTEYDVNLCESVVGIILRKTFPITTNPKGTISNSEGTIIIIPRCPTPPFFPFCYSPYVNVFEQQTHKYATKCRWKMN